MKQTRKIPELRQKLNGGRNKEMVETRDKFVQFKICQTGGTSRGF